MKYDLSIIIPARNEEFLGRTVEDILQNIEGKTEIIIVLDGYEKEIPKIPEDPRITVIKNETSIGQRAATNQACRLSEAKYIIKTDAHCAFDKGFDVKLMNEMQDNWTMVPIMRNLHAFNWVCEEGHTRYQGPSGPCGECGKPTTKDVVWIAKTNPQSSSYCFDEEPHFQYFNEYRRRPEYVGDITETMSLQGSFFMLTREKYWELNICDEEFGSWGSQGIEVAVKTWLSGGRVVCNHKTWYAHMFRTQGGDFGFPYSLSGRQVDHAKKKSRELFFDNKWEKQIYPLSWLIEKFWPVKGWSEEKRQELKKWTIDNWPDKSWLPEEKNETSRGIIYYTDNKLKWSIAKNCRRQLISIGLPIVSCSLKPSNIGTNIVFKGERGYKTMFQQILTALKASTADIIYFGEHDVLYHPSHFDFIPKDRNTFYYNGNYWMVRSPDGFAVHYNITSLSGLVAYRDILITHFEERLERIEKEGFGYYMGFEPMTHGRVKWKNLYKFENFNSKYPNIDIAHGANLTKKRWSQDKFIRKPKFWVEGTVDDIPGWKDLRKLIQ